MDPDAPGPSLNEYQARRLRVTCQHIDTLLADIEYILGEPESGTAFPRYVPDIPPAQRRTIEDHVARIRAQLLRVLDGQGIARESPPFPASRSIHTALISIDIAVEELKPHHMRGLGDVPPAAATELNGIVGELHGLVARLDRYVAEGAGQDLNERLRRLGTTGNDLRLLEKIEQVVTARGLVEFRGAIAAVLDRAEDRNFEIALFGRVSSGKSSLLNAVLGTDVLPVGVTPVTAVPTRITYGETPGFAVSFADAPRQTFEISRLAEFASEQHNPGNKRHVARILVTIPSDRLREGVVFVDTPGLGSLATQGAAETRAYLPRCDLGVVLVDAGSTLTAEDVGTVLALHQAGIPIEILLSKADLPAPADLARLLGYVQDHLASETAQSFPVHAVSVLPSHRRLLDEWFEQRILPLYGRSRELRDLSLQRKIGTLRESVGQALRTRLAQDTRSLSDNVEAVRKTEARMRRAQGSIDVTRSAGEHEAEGLCGMMGEISHEVASVVIGSAAHRDATEGLGDDRVNRAIYTRIQQRVDKVRWMIEECADRLESDLVASAEDLDLADVPEKGEFRALVREMPAFNPGKITLDLPRPAPSVLFGRSPSQKRLAEQVRRQLDPALEPGLSSYTRVLGEWVRSVTGRLAERFELYAERYRAQADLLTGRTQDLTSEEIQEIEGDIRELESL
jgi:GTP-binding protein EngB required for normal cell division